MSRRAVGEARPSQIITTFGPGAIVDLEKVSIIVAGIDNWPVDIERVIHEPRLQRALQVERFFSPRPCEGAFGARLGTVPAYLFPRYQHCPVCQTLACFGGPDVAYDARWGEVTCRAPNCRGRGPRRRALSVPAPFIVACPSGHLDDFPWRDYCHGGATPCRQRMKLYSAARTGTVADIHVSCECGRDRSVGEAFGEGRAAVLGACSRKRPWLGLDNVDPTPCAQSANLRAMQRGATNGWFPVLKSALAVREAASPAGVALRACDPKQIEKIDSEANLALLIKMGMFPSLVPFAVEEVWTSLRKLRGELETDEVDLRWPEWQAFRDPASASSDRGELFLEEGVVPPRFARHVQRVVLARKLLEIRALTGFSRIDTASPGDGVSPIFAERRNWLPAVEVRGEGILIELREDALAAWETSSCVIERSAEMAARFAEWERERGVPTTPFPGARHILLHSLAHALIRQLSLDCGYSASAVRERIYSSSDPQRTMAGILLYTASPDSEGSLGGLVDLGAPERFPDLLRGALRSAAQCSSDPLCAGHRPDVHSTINAAACHACVLVSETSCESFNRFLDRNVLVPTIARSDLAFFDRGLL